MGGMETGVWALLMGFFLLPSLALYGFLAWSIMHFVRRREALYLLVALAPFAWWASAAQVMRYLMNVKKMSTWLNAAGGLTLLSGLGMMWRNGALMGETFRKRGYTIRKNVFEYDETMNLQREAASATPFTCATARGAASLLGSRFSDTICATGAP